MNAADVPGTDEVRAAFVMQTTRFRITYGELFDAWLAEHDAEIELAVYERIRHSASTPYSFHPYLDSAIARRKPVSTPKDADA